MPAELFPAFMKLDGRSCLVVGAGSIASSKIASLLRAGARITVVAPQAKAAVASLAATKNITWLEREFRAEDLNNVFLAIAATGSNAVNRAVFFAAQKRGILCNAVDDPPHCDFYFPAVVRRGDLQIAISTAGESPSVAQRFRREIEASLDLSLGNWLRFVGSLRRHVLGNHPPSDERNKLLHLLAYSQICDSKDCKIESRSIEFAGRHVHLPEHLPEESPEHARDRQPALQEQP
ncbi:MAG: bifunctional precorrin-2 dehydrogenase/sirohydrochlorin ferrochelatase [Candidatus Acidiferrales bacterium]